MESVTGHKLEYQNNYGVFGYTFRKGRDGKVREGEEREVLLPNLSIVGEICFLRNMKDFVPPIPFHPFPFPPHLLSKWRKIHPSISSLSFPFIFSHPNKALVRMSEEKSNCNYRGKANERIHSELCIEWSQWDRTPVLPKDLGL